MSEQLDVPIDVSFVLPSLDAGGAERVAINLANGLAAGGTRPRMLLSGHGGTLAAGLSSEVPLVELGRPRLRDAVRLLLRTLREDPPDVILTTHLHMNLLLCLLRPLLPSRTRLVIREPIHLATPSEADIHRMRRWQRLLYPRADLVIATSELMAAELTARIRARVRTLRNPVDESAIRASAMGAVGAEAREADGTSEPAGRRYVAIGRLTPQKAYPDLLRAFARTSGAADTLQIFGEGPDRTDLERLVDDLGLTGRVKLEGLDSDLWMHLAASDVLVLASTYEGMPNAALEALALGVPVLATTDLAVLEEVRRIAVPGAVTLVPRDDLADALQQVRRRDAESQLEQGRLGASLLPPEHRVEVVIETLRGLLLEIPSRRRSRTVRNR